MAKPVKPLTAAGRLALVLPWLNGDPIPHRELRARLSRFVLETHYTGPNLLRVYVPPRRWRDRRERGLGDPWRPERLERLRVRLRALLDDPEPRALPSLRVSLAAVKQGSYRRLVAGELDDLVTDALIQTLTETGTVVLRCKAPAPGNWSERCGRFIVAGGRGRPRKYCSGACRVRHHAEEGFKREAEALRYPTRAQRRK